MTFCLLGWAVKADRNRASLKGSPVPGDDVPGDIYCILRELRYDTLKPKMQPRRWQVSARLKWHHTIGHGPSQGSPAPGLCLSEHIWSQKTSRSCSWPWRPTEAFHIKQTRGNISNRLESSLWQAAALFALFWSPTTQRNICHSSWYMLHCVHQLVEKVMIRKTSWKMLKLSPQLMSFITIHLNPLLI